MLLTEPALAPIKASAMLTVLSLLYHPDNYYKRSHYKKDQLKESFKLFLFASPDMDLGINSLVF